MAVALCCSACTDKTDKLRATATAAVRDIAQEAAQRLREAVPPLPASIEKAVGEIVADRPGRATVITKNVPQNGMFKVSFAFLALVGDGDISEYKQIAVRLCATYSGDSARAGKIDVVDLSCPPGLPGPSNGVPVDREVKLSD